MAEPDRKVWADVLAHLRANHPTINRQWFDELEPLSIAGGTFHLRAHSHVHRDYLQRHCLAPFNDSLQAVTGRLIGVRFVGPADDVDTSPPPETPATPNGLGHKPVVDKPTDAALRRAASLPINPDHTFDSFVVGPGNRLAHAASVAVANKPGGAYNPLFVHGGVGLGKTHILQAICLKILEATPDAVMYYTSCEDFITRFMESVQAGEMADFRHRFRDVDILVIDDIHFLANRDRTQEEFFHTFNSVHQAGKQIILSSDAPPEEIPDLEERLVSRFKWGLVAKIEPPDYETRVEILKTKARLRGLNLPDEVACYIAARIESNIRELEGAIGKLQIQSVVEHKPIDASLARLALGDLPSARGVSEVSIQIILSAVTNFYGVRVADLQSKRRHRSVTLPRQLCMYLARKHTRYSLEEIGGYFGGRDHTTVMHAVKAVEERCGQDSEFQGAVKTIEGDLRPRAIEPAA